MPATMAAEGGAGGAQGGGQRGEAPGERGATGAFGRRVGRQAER